MAKGIGDSGLPVSELESLRDMTAYPNLFEAGLEPVENHVPDILSIFLNQKEQICPGELVPEAGYFYLRDIRNTPLHVGFIPREMNGIPVNSKALHMDLRVETRSRRKRVAHEGSGAGLGILPKHFLYFVETNYEGEAVEYLKIVGSKGDETICLERSMTPDGDMGINVYIPDETGYMMERHIASYALDSNGPITYIAEGDRTDDEPITVKVASEVTQDDISKVTEYLEILDEYASKAEKALKK